MNTDSAYPREPDDGYAYFIGRTPYFACSADPRFSYCLYVPQQIRHLCVYLHGTNRDAASYRDRLSKFAEANGVLLICPLFPAGIIDPLDVDNYKFLLYRGIRFDLVLLSMIDEVKQRYALSSERFLLGGFSGGAQFVHRFAYLHPQRIQALSIASPGRVTLLDETLDWWSGTRNVEQLFGKAIDTTPLRDLPVQFLVGERDNADYSVREGSAEWVPGANLAGVTRVERLKSLCQQFQEIGCHVEIELVADCAHEWPPLRDPTVSFFERLLTAAS